MAALTAAALTVTACTGTGSTGKASTENAPAAASTQETAMEKEPASEPGYSMVTEEEAIAIACQMADIDIAPYVSGAEGTVKDRIAYIRAGIQPGKEQALEKALIKRCGESLSEFTRPSNTQDPILSSLSNADIYRLYTYTRQGDNGAKTKTTEIFLVREEEGGMSVYILGHS